MKCPEKFDINYIDCSSLDCFERCPFKYMLTRCMGLQEPHASPKNYFAYGRILHECLPLVYNNTFDHVWAHFELLWDQEGFVGDDLRNKDTAHLLLKNFWEARQPDKCPYDIVKLDLPKLDIVDSVSDGEIPFLVDIGGPLPFAGRIDMPVRLKQTGTLWAMDYKTSQDISTRLFQSFEMHPQALGYPIALSLLTGENVNGLIVEAVRVCKIPKRPSKVPPNQWHPVYINDQKMQTFLDWALRLSEQIIHCNESNYWPRNLGGCSAYAMYGIPGGVCQYQNLCANFGENYYEFIQSYDREPWHPFTLKDPASPESGQEGTA